MRRLIILCTIALATTLVGKAQTVNVTINKLYCDTSSFELPKKTIKQKMPLMIIANQKYDFTTKLVDIARRIATDDFENNVFTVMLKYSGVGISIVIESQDILDLENAMFHGDMIVDKRHFVLLENEDNKDLLKTYFKKVRGKETVFERTFEKVSQIIYPEPTHYNAIYNERMRTVKENEVIINNIDKLHVNRPPIPDNRQQQNLDDDDIFKIDVELSNE